jgi:hypothetical protein
MEGNFNGELITRDIIAFPGFERAGRRQPRKLLDEKSTLAAPFAT